MHTPIKTWLGVTVIIIMALSAGMFIWYQQKNLAVDSQTTIIKPGAKQKECTAEAKLCPDGSAVGRTGPNCEFAPCSGEKTADVKCAQTSDCRLVYTGSSCSPCDYGSEEYKCVSPAQAKIIQDTWIQRSGGVQCEMCLSEERNFNFECTCNSGICEKTEKIDFSSWQTYRNEKYGFEFKYPKDWKFCGEHYPSSETERSQSNYVDVCNNGDTEKLLDFVVDVNNFAITDRCSNLSSCVEIYNDIGNSSPGWEITDQIKTKFLSFDAISQIVLRKEHGWAHFQSFIFKNNLFYKFELLTNYNNQKEGKKINNQILSTFKFID